MKKMTKWLAVCAVCVMGSVPAMAAEVPDVTVTPIPIETPAPDVTPIETPAPTPIPEVKNGWYEYGTKNKKYFKDGQYLTGMRKIHGEVYYFSPKGFMKTGWIKYNNKKYYFGSNGIRYSVGLYDWIEQQTGLEAAYVGELVSVSVDSGLTLTNGEPLTIGGSDSLKIIIRGVDAESCGKIAEAVKTYMEQQQGNLNTRLGSHELVLLSEVSGNIMNMDVMNQQTVYRNLIYGLETTIAAAKAAFSEDQKQYYTLLMKENGLEDTTDAEQSIVEEEQLVPENPAVSKKYVVLGAVLFAFIYAAVLCMGYIFNSRIRVNDGLQDLYGIPQIGVVVKDSKKKLFLDRWVNGLRHYGKREFTAEQSMELVFAAIKIAAAKNGQNSICLMGCNLGAGADKVCEGLKAALEKEGLSVTILNNVLYDAEAMEKVSAAQGAVLVEKAGSTLYNEIVAELELLKRLEIPVLGGITVE